ncbi:hypothetical protein Trco_005248 [Trichoderma cornu-damae]|uniref:Uncharacterized protein n=1 Tax=Trichoderma cornu-damae TaxID=654480 RepID=A0A9P8QH33_9HYPO|nr:hypothetical protein Trco_005248 [Trichoderma cornu-damae]
MGISANERLEIGENVDALARVLCVGVPEITEAVCGRPRFSRRVQACSSRWTIGAALAAAPDP